jgi:hypothetical protein
MKASGDNLTFFHQYGTDRRIRTRLPNTLSRFVECRSHENLVAHVSHSEA